MTTLCGLAQNYWHLMLARSGLASASGRHPPSTSLLADKFPPAKRPMALTVFAPRRPLGAWLGSRWPGVSPSISAGAVRFSHSAYRASWSRCSST
jgi:hypothetical protein